VLQLELMTHGGLMVQIDRLDHLVLTVANLEITIEFYQHVLGMDVVRFGDNRVALSFGSQKINLHKYGQEFEPKAKCPTPGSADLCFVTSMPLQHVIEHLGACGVSIIEGPVRRTGARGPLQSVYIRDPDLNLIEIANEEVENEN
jgi:catechol 2,3-dioxygenase-like lactoylglutathione lyase family enzyme